MFIISTKIFFVYNRMHAPQTFYCHEQKASEHQVLFPMSEGPIALVKFSLSYKPNFLKFIYPRLQICDCLFHFILCNNKFSIFQPISIRCKSTVLFSFSGFLLTSGHRLHSYVLTFHLCYSSNNGYKQFTGFF